jgi:hypothetical protein
MFQLSIFVFLLLLLKLRGLPNILYSLVIYFSQFRTSDLFLEKIKYESNKYGREALPLYHLLTPLNVNLILAFLFFVVSTPFEFLFSSCLVMGELTGMFVLLTGLLEMSGCITLGF